MLNFYIENKYIQLIKIYIQTILFLFFFSKKKNNDNKLNNKIINIKHKNKSRLSSLDNENIENNR